MEASKSGAVTKHMPVTITLDGDIRRRRVQQIARLPRMTVKVPIGCHRIDPGWAEWERGREADAAGCGLEAAASEWLKIAAREISRNLQLGENFPHQRWGEPLRKVWLPALAECAAVPRATVSSRLWRFTSSRVNQLQKLRAQGRWADAWAVEHAMKRYMPNPRDGDRPWQWDCWWRPWVLCISEADDDNLAWNSGR